MSDSFGGAQISAGSSLKNQREEKKLSIEEVARELRLTTTQVAALENDDFQSFAGPVFIHGYIRNYCKFLGLESKELIAAADYSLRDSSQDFHTISEDGNSIESKNDTDSSSVHKPDFGVSVTVIFFLIAIFAGLAVYFLNKVIQYEPEVAQVELIEKVLEKDQSKKPNSATVDRDSIEDYPDNAKIASVTVPKENTIGSTASDGDLGTILLVFDQESWVEIKDGDGETIFAQLNEKASRQTVRGIRPLSLIIGNAPGVRLFFEDVEVDLKLYTRVSVGRVTLE